jgi:hypothetical protein
MTVVTLKAHFDGKNICLDEPCELTPNTPVLVTLVHAIERERDEWFAFAQAAFARAYGENEPDYSNAVIREPSSE